MSMIDLLIFGVVPGDRTGDNDRYVVGLGGVFRLLVVGAVTVQL